MNLAATMTQSALKWPHKTALVFEGQRWTYGQWNDWVNRAAGAFAASGVVKGDRVAFFTYNLPEQITGFYALMKLGAIPVPINYRLAPNEVKYIIEDCGAKMLVFEETLRDPVMAIKDQLKIEKLIYIGAKSQADEIRFDDFVAAGQDQEPQVQVGWHDPALIMYTSGTTGRPKGVVRSHLAEIVGSMTMAVEVGFRHEDVILHNKPLFHIAVPDGLPFDSDEAAVAHVISVHLERFFDKAEVEIEAPKGSYQVINRCGVTGELLGPPNYHRYNQIVQQHYTSRLSGRMGPEAFRGRIETVRDPELVNQWLAKMKKATRYTWKTAGAEAPAASPVADAPAETPAEAPAAENAAPAAPATPFFDTLEDARLHLLTHARDKVVRTSENARFAGRLLETLPPGEIRRAVEGALERQRRFPLDTANGLRGRLRREHFTIFKKGSKGVSYVCAVKRKFRVPGQTFADSIGTLIAYIEANPMVRAGELPVKFLGLKPAVAPAQVSPAPASAEGSSAETPAAPEVAAAKTEEVSIEDRARLARLQGDLMWLVREGYVTEFIDGRLFAPPPMVEARKKEIEAEEHDPENFPEAPASAESPAAAEPAPSEAVADPAPIVEQAPETPQAGEPAAQG